MEQPRETTGRKVVPFTSVARRITRTQPEARTFGPGFGRFLAIFGNPAKSARLTPVFLLATKLTMKEIGTDNLVICHEQTIEPVIRTFQSG